MNKSQNIAMDCSKHAQLLPGDADVAHQEHLPLLQLRGCLEYPFQFFNIVACA